MTVSSPVPLHSWLVLIAVGVLIFLLNIDYTAVNLTLVPISEEINADLSDLQWLLSAYVLVWAALVIPAGRVADLYGKRNTLIVGLLLFMAGSCLTGFAHSLELLIGGRILQGVGAAVFTAPAWATIFTTASPERQGFVMGIILSFAGFGLAAGPTLAGFIIRELSWRWIFYINIPLGLIVIAILVLYAKKETLAVVKQSIDFLGTFLLASSLCTLVYGINQIEVWGVYHPLFWMTMGIGVLLMMLFTYFDRQQSFRMIPSHLLKNKGFMAASAGGFFISMSFSMVLVLMGLYLQNTLRYSNYDTGLIFISLTISMGLLSPIGGKIIDLFGVKEPMVFGALCTAVGMGLMAFSGVSPSLFYIVLSLFFVGTGLGAYFTASNIAMMRAAPQTDLNVASGLYTMFMMMGNTLSIVLSTSFVVLFGRIHLLGNIEKNGIHLSAAQHQDLVEIIAKVEHSVSQLKDFPTEQIPQLIKWIDEAFVYGFSLDMLSGMTFALIAAGLAFWGVKNTGETVPQQAAPLHV